MRQRVSRFIASVFGIGHIPLLPGTLASLAGLLFYAFYGGSLGAGILGWIALITVIGWIASHLALKGEVDPDPSWIVIDEVIGMLVTFCFIPIRWPFLLLGFCLFRFFDIVKPFPVDRLERIPGASGVLLDDVGAGVYANLILQIFVRLTS